MELEAGFQYEAAKMCSLPVVVPLNYVFWARDAVALPRGFTWSMYLAQDTKPSKLHNLGCSKLKSVASWEILSRSVLVHRATSDMLRYERLQIIKLLMMKKI